MYFELDESYFGGDMQNSWENRVSNPQFLVLLKQNRGGSSLLLQKIVQTQNVGDLKLMRATSVFAKNGDEKLHL